MVVHEGLPHGRIKTASLGETRCCSGDAPCIDNRSSTKRHAGLIHDEHIALQRIECSEDFGTPHAGLDLIEHRVAAQALEVHRLARANIHRKPLNDVAVGGGVWKKDIGHRTDVRDNTLLRNPLINNWCCQSRWRGGPKRNGGRKRNCGPNTSASARYSSFTMGLCRHLVSH